MLLDILKTLHAGKASLWFRLQPSQCVESVGVRPLEPRILSNDLLEDSNRGAVACAISNCRRCKGLRVETLEVCNPGNVVLLLQC